MVFESFLSLRPCVILLSQSLTNVHCCCYLSQRLFIRVCETQLHSVLQDSNAPESGAIILRYNCLALHDLFSHGKLDVIGNMVLHTMNCSRDVILRSHDQASLALCIQGDAGKVLLGKEYWQLGQVRHRNGKILIGMRMTKWQGIGGRHGGPSG